jgi:hypothetical protein
MTRKSTVFGWLPGVEAVDTVAKGAALHGDSSFGLALGNDVFACLYRAPSLFLATRELTQSANKLQAVKPYVGVWKSSFVPVVNDTAVSLLDTSKVTRPLFVCSVVPPYRFTYCNMMTESRNSETRRGGHC